MILIGLLIGLVLFIAVVFLCIAIPEISYLEWILLAFLAIVAALCGYGASKYKEKEERNKH